MLSLTPSMHRFVFVSGVLHGRSKNWLWIVSKARADKPRSHNLPLVISADIRKDIYSTLTLLLTYADALTSFYLWICNKRYLLPLILLKLRYATSIIPSSSASLPRHVHYRTILVLSLRNEKASQNHFQRVSDSWDRRWGWEHLWRWLALDLSKGSADMTSLDVLLGTAQSQFFLRVSQVTLAVLWL